jgi:protein-S-isoprenylcysteine O-methyltransferase Ste14
MIGLKLLMWVAGATAALVGLFVLANGSAVPEMMCVGGVLAAFIFVLLAIIIGRMNREAKEETRTQAIIEAIQKQQK